MARTVKDVVDRAGITLQDKSGTRYLTSELVGYLIDGLHVVRTLRPDLFIGGFGTPLPDTLALTDTLPVPDHLFSRLADYVAGSAELRDDEFALDGRAMMLRESLAKQLVQGI